MKDYEGIILARDERNYEEGFGADEITVHFFNSVTGRYDIEKTYRGESATRYMEESGIW